MSFYRGTFLSPDKIRETISPYVDREEILSSLNIRSYDLIVPMALTPNKKEYASKYKPFFPVRIDTGFDGDFIISWKHFHELARWTMRPQLVEYGDFDIIFANGERETHSGYRGSLWLANSEFNEARRIPMGGGFAICSTLTEDGDPIPRLPTIGQRPLRLSGAQLQIDYGAMSLEWDFLEKP